MKKVLIVLATGILLLTGCSTNEDVSVVKETYVFADSNKEFVIGEEFSKEVYGEPNQYSELQSCAFDGLDKVYTYDHYEVTTYPDGEKERIYSVYIMDDSVSTKEGIKITDTYEKMIEAYGEEFENMGSLYKYTKENSYLKFIVDNGVITSIEYGLEQ